MRDQYKKQTPEEYRAYCAQEIEKLPAKEAQDAAWLLVHMGLILQRVLYNAFDELEAEFLLPGSQKRKSSTRFLVTDHTELNKEEGISPGDEDYVPAGLTVAKRFRIGYDGWSQFYSHTTEDVLHFIGDGGSIGLGTNVTPEGDIEISSRKTSRKFVLTKESLKTNDRPFTIVSK